MRAARQLAVEADVHIHVRNFQVINQVGLSYLNTLVLSSLNHKCHLATGGRGEHQRQARLRRICLNPLCHVALRSGQLCRPRVAPALGVDLLRNLRDGPRQPARLDART